MKIFSIKVSLTRGGRVFLCSLFLVPLLQQFEIKYMFFERCVDLVDGWLYRVECF